MGAFLLSTPQLPPPEVSSLSDVTKFGKAVARITEAVTSLFAFYTVTLIILATTFVFVLDKPAIGPYVAWVLGGFAGLWLASVVIVTAFGVWKPEVLKGVEDKVAIHGEVLDTEALKRVIETVVREVVSEEAFKQVSPGRRDE